MLWHVGHSLAQAADVPVPVSMNWVPGLLLAIVWLFVAAAIAGPLVRFWEQQRRS